MDLAEIKPIEKRHDVRHPGTLEPTGMILVLACTHDEAVKRKVREVNDQIVKAGKDMSEDKERELDAALVAAYIVDVEFTGDATWKGETPKYSDKLAREICSIQSLKEQVMQEVRSVRDFYKA